MGKWGLQQGLCSPPLRSRRSKDVLCGHSRSLGTLSPLGHTPTSLLFYGSGSALSYPPRYLNLKNLALDSCFHAACCPAICTDHFCIWTPHSHPPAFLELGEITDSVPTPAFLHIPDMKAVGKHAESSPIYFFLPCIPSTLMSGEYLKEKNLT